MQDLNDSTALMLLALQALALGLGFIMLGWMFATQRRQNASPASNLPRFQTPSGQRPECWLAIRSVSPEAVKEALGLNHAEPCSWAEGLAGDREFFISPRVHGWVIVTGRGLPHPGDDVDATFLFLTALSRQLGHVQFFHADRIMHHHAWARLDDGTVTRAYAWAGETVWSQGIETLPEIEVGVKTFAYGDHAATILDGEMNFDKVPLLAARWSIDPARVKLNSFRQSIGLAGESA
jgi:hypothetical protein